MKQILFRLLILITLSLLGGLLYPLTINLMVMADMFSTETMEGNFGYELTQKTVFVWLGAILIGFSALFIRSHWYKILICCPLIAPTLFALVYVTIQ